MEVGQLAVMHNCTLCGKAYKRPEHLQRHVLTHSDERPHKCQQCQKTFQRSDVLRRHSKTCTASFPTPAEATSLAADITTTPFAANLNDEWMGDLSAYLDWLPDVDQYANLLTIETYPVSNLPAPNEEISNNASTRTSAPLRFLECFTRNTGLVASFDCGTEPQRVGALLFLRSEARSHHFLEMLSRKCDEIVTLISEVATVKPRNSAVDLVWSPDVKGACTSFFNAERISLYMDLFWSLWHPNVNLMHRATFDGATAKAGLVAAMAIIGAAVSPDSSDNKIAKVWFDAVEEFVFIDDDFCSGQHSSRAFPALQRIQSLQAAYLVCLYQNWEGTDVSKARIRRFRYSTVVATARDFGISNARHVQGGFDNAAFTDWTVFAAREQLIRTLLWVFLLDTAFVIFHNFPPRMAIREMGMNFACTEQVFQADNADEWSNHWSTERTDIELTVASLVERICRGRLDLNVQARIASLGPLNLFAVASALHVMIFQAQQTFNVLATVQPLSHALQNWIVVWHVYTGALQHLPSHNTIVHEPITSSNMWKRVGFSRFADEYWLLARLITEKMKASAEKAELVRNPGVDSLAPTEVPDDYEAILSTYDETSMQQVNNLISDFQKILI